MENKRTLYSLESDIRRILEDNDFISTGDEGGKQWYRNLVSDLATYTQQELDKAREEGRREGSEITSRYISDFVISESGKSGRKEILEYIDKLSKLKQ